MRMLTGLAAGGLLACLASGCAGFLRSNAQPDQTYYLRPAPLTAAATVDAAASAPGEGSGVRVSVRVGSPQAAPGLDSAHIVLLQADHRMNYYAASRWPATAPEVIASLAVQSLRATGAFSAVEDPASPFPADYLLQIAVRHFEAEYSGGGPPTVHVVLDCSLGRREGRAVIDSFVAQGEATAGADRMGEVVAAFEQATRAALDALAQHTAQAVHAHALPRAGSEH